jgi:hypothetical protein
VGQGKELAVREPRYTAFGRAFLAVMDANGMSRTEVAAEVTRARPRGSKTCDATTIRNALEGTGRLKTEFVTELLAAVGATADQRAQVWRAYAASVFDKAGVDLVGVDADAVLGGWQDFVAARDLDQRLAVEGLPATADHARARRDRRKTRGDGLTSNQGSHD